MALAEITLDQKPTWERAVLFLFPTIELEGTLWQNLWDEERRQQFKIRMRFVWLIAAVGYIAHFFLVDMPAEVKPLPLWAIYRFGLATCFLAGSFLTFTRFVENRSWYWIPYALITLVGCYLQALSMLWDPRVPVFFSFILPAMMVAILGFGLVPSLFFVSMIFSLQWQPLHQAMSSDPEGARMIVSAFIAELVWTILVRSGYSKDVQTFIKRQLLIQERQKVIEGQKELTNQLKGFVPAEIFDRIVTYNKKHRMTITQATDEVIRPRKKRVACIHSDIRSFTRDSKDIDAYLLDRAIPNIRLITEIAESRRGIARLVGDLILTYFDQDDPMFSLLLAVDCGMQISDSNNSFNHMHQEGGAHDIRRNVIISFGTCIVGNIGATDHAREITPLGPPVNLINRIDTLLKNDHETLRINLNNSIIITKQAAEALRTIVPQLEIHTHRLDETNLAIRDFPEERQICSVPCTEHNKQWVRNTLSRFEIALTKDTRSHETVDSEQSFKYAV